VTVVDSVVGDLSGSFPDVLGVGESASLEYTHVVTDADPDPLENTVTVTGTGEDSTATAEATAGCETAIPPPPELPVTGADLGAGVPLLLIFLLSGLAFLFLSRRPEMALAVVGSSRRPVARDVEAGSRTGATLGLRAARFKPYRGAHRRPKPAWIRRVPRGP
jgi:LPXTG-motif cell wall-anchored protein